MAADLVIETLALSERERFDEARELAADGAIWREMAHAALAEIARLARRVAAVERTLLALRAELRRYTSSVVGRTT